MRALESDPLNESDANTNFIGNGRTFFRLLTYSQNRALV